MVATRRRATPRKPRPSEERGAFTDIDPRMMKGAIQGNDEIQAAARRAISRMRGSLHSLNGYAKAVTGDARTRVVIHAGNACTDGEIIYMKPPIEMGMDIPHDPAMCGERDKYDVLKCRACEHEESVNITLRHEIGHIVEHSFQTMADEDKADLFKRALGEYKPKAMTMEEAIEHAIKFSEDYTGTPEEWVAAIDAEMKREYETRASEGADKRVERMKERIAARERSYGRDLNFVEANQLISPWLPQIFNALEDARVNVGMYRARPGLYKQFRGHINKIFQEGILREDGQYHSYAEFPKNVQVIIGLMAKAMGHEYAEFLDEDVVEAIDAPEVTRLIKNVQQARSARSIYKLGFPILEALKKRGFMGDEYDQEDEFPPPPTMPSKPEPEDEQKPANAKDSKPGERDDSESSEPEQKSEQADAPDDGSEEADAAPGDDQEDADSEPGDDEEPGDGADGDTDDDADEDASGASDGDQDDDADEGDADGDTGGDTESDEPGEGAGQDEDSDDTDGDTESDKSGADGDEFDDGDSSESGDQPDGDADYDSDYDGTGEDSEDDDDGSGEATGDADWDEDDEESDDDEDDDEDGWPGGPNDEDDEPDDSDAESEEASEPESSEDSEPSLKPSDDGTPQDAEKAIEVFGGHKAGWNPMADSEGGRAPDPTDVELDRAILQGEFFDAPSRSVFGVKLHVDEGPGFDRFCQWDEVIAEAVPPYRGDYEEERDEEFPELFAPESILGPALREMRLTFDANKKSAHIGNLRSGSVNTRVLARRVPFGDDRVFQRRRRPERRSYFVVLGLDISGSTAIRTVESDGTRRMRIVRMKMAVQAQADLLSRCGVDFAVYAHTGTQNPDLPGTVDLNIHVIKGPKDRWDTAAHERLHRVSASHANLDGHTIEFYRKVCDKQSATDKLIMYYTDGAMPAENYNEELEVLQRELKLAPRHGVTIVGIGVDTDSPKEHGLDTIQLDDIKDVPNVVKALKERLK